MVGLKSKYSLAILGVGIAILLFVLILPARSEQLFTMSYSVPVWMDEQQTSPFFYAVSYLQTYPLLVYLFPLGSVILVWMHGRRGLFVVLSFAVLFALHSFVFPRKSDRYASYFFVFFVITSCNLMAVLARSFLAWFEGLSAPRLARPLTAAGIMFATGILVLPLLRLDYQAITSFRYPDWKPMPQALADRLARATSITTRPTAYVQYVGHLPDAVLRITRNEIADPDYEGPVSIITDVSQFREFLSRKPEGELLIIGDTWSLKNPAFVSAETLQLIEQEFVLEELAWEKRLRIYRFAGNPHTHGTSGE